MSGTGRLAVDFLDAVGIRLMDPQSDRDLSSLESGSAVLGYLPTGPPVQQAVVRWVF